MLRRQTLAEVTTVPTSDKPEMKEWTGHYWYVLRCGALQASVSLTDGQAVDLIAWFKGFAVTTPCPDCRAHFLADFALYPFEMKHAKDPMQAMFWVEELRRRIEQRKEAAITANKKGTSNTALPPPATIDSSRPPPIPVVAKPEFAVAAGVATANATPLSPSKAIQGAPSANLFGGRLVTLGGRHQVAAPMLPRAASTGNSSMRKLAIQSAMQQTIANRVAEKAGVPRGCGCGKKKPPPKVV